MTSKRPISTWQVSRTEPGAVGEPADIPGDALVVSSQPTSTVGSILAQLYSHRDRIPSSLEDYDWWYQSEFPGDVAANTPVFLDLEGLATIATIWLNGVSLLSTRNMFRRHLVDITGMLREKNELVVVFRSVRTELKRKRPRGRWKTNLVDDQQLRWIRTSLIGRIPGWTPELPAIGPWRDVSIVTTDGVSIVRDGCWADVNDGTGTINIELDLAGGADSGVEAVTVTALGRRIDLPVEWQGNLAKVSGRLQIEEVPLWHPHTHGPSDLVTLEIAATGSDNVLLDRRLGFRTVELDRSDGHVEFLINGNAVFCRGGCWSTNDIDSFSGEPDKLRRSLELVRDAGANMIRVGGTMTYESDDFYSLCDELGILVWQDFMFASMDYPFEDEEFLGEVREEVSDQLNRLRRFCSVVSWCGGSETEQQAAMFGKPRDDWQNPLFSQMIPDILDSAGVKEPYFRSSPCDGHLPFHNATGISHYFGVGAYRQDFNDLAKSDVRFATECLAFANIPSGDSLLQRFGTKSPVVHTPQWKQGVPRDSAAGWDFEDIRDHYFESEFGLSARNVRYSDNRRYLLLSTYITGMIMASTFDYWRTQSRCSGGLVWLLNDLVPGAGWGLIDSDGQPKPALQLVGGSWQPMAIAIADRGMDGIYIVMKNETDNAFPVNLSIQMFADQKQCITSECVELNIAARETLEISIDEISPVFTDHLNRYAFGPARQDAIVVSLTDQDETLVARRTVRALSDFIAASDCEITVSKVDDNEFEISANRVLQGVLIESPNAKVHTGFFDLVPGQPQKIELTRLNASPVRGTVRAVNWLGEQPFRV